MCASMCNSSENVKSRVSCLQCQHLLHCSQRSDSRCCCCCLWVDVTDISGICPTWGRGRCCITLSTVVVVASGSMSLTLAGSGRFWRRGSVVTPPPRDLRDGHNEGIVLSGMTGVTAGMKIVFLLVQTRTTIPARKAMLKHAYNILKCVPYSFCVFHIVFKIPCLYLA